MKEIKDYLHLYIGAKAIVKFANQKPGLRGITAMNLYNWFGPKNCIDKAGNPYFIVKPILHHLRDMTEAQFIELAKLQKRGLLNGVDIDALEAEQFRYLLSKHFDLFGLIESGLAIDKTTLK